MYSSYESYIVPRSKAKIIRAKFVKINQGSSSSLLRMESVGSYGESDEIMWQPLPENVCQTKLCFICYNISMHSRFVTNQLQEARRQKKKNNNKRLVRCATFSSVVVSRIHCVVWELLDSS